MSNPVLPPLALQTMVFSQSYDRNSETGLDRIFAAVKASGFEAVEAGFPDSEVLQRLLLRHGLKQAANHIVLSASSDPEPILRQFQITGARDVCNSGLLKWGDLNVADYQHAIETLNRLGQTLRGEGVHLHYHHHEFEFNPLPCGRTGLELLLSGFDVSAVDLCVDVGWLQRSGKDPASFLRTYREMIGYLHLKDTTETNWTELGRGNVDWPTVVKEIKALPHVRWATVEQDSTTLDPAESCAISRGYLRENFQY